jgi:starch-binding outer membrane protein, SusD/RagB family
MNDYSNSKRKKMKIFRNKIFLPLIVWVSLASCKKEFLDLTPSTSLTPNQALATPADLQVALRGAYAGLRGVDFYGRTLPVIGDVMADNVYQSVINTNRYTQFVNYTFTKADGNIAGIWNTAYTVILRANNIINSTVDASPAVNQYKGEAYAIRALCYFTLVRYFARPYTDNPNGLGVPIVTVRDPTLEPARNTVAEVYTQIIADLDQAYNLMTMYVNSSQFSKYAAKGLQAKVYLTKGDKANAKTAALDVINNGGFTLVTAANHASYWSNPAVTTNKVETLFEVSSDAVANLAFDALSYLYSQAGNYGDLLLASDLYALIDPADVRKALYPTGTRGGFPSVFVNKYPAISGDRSDTKVLRLSEIYLIAAEASLPGNEPDALLYVNAIRTRRNAPLIAATGSALFEAIITERRIELAAEGDRYMDLMRLKRDVNRGPNFPSSVLQILYSDFKRVLPIPQAEMDVNQNMEQNPGW